MTRGALRPRRRTLFLLLAVAALGAPAAAQAPDTVEIVAGARYAAGALQERLLGRDYRDLWTTPVRIPVLDLGAFGGGLVPVERGGGEQTRSLRLVGPEGREYNFRSVDKWVTPDPRSDLEGTLAERLVQDQVSSLHPAATVVATGLLEAVGILHPDPRLVVMPDDPRLGQFREEFAGLLGTIEVHADEAEDGSWSFAGSEEVESEEDFFRALREDPANRVDARALLAERLMSLLMGDWDRHAGQYRWARYDSAGVRRWVPVPEDRDYAFADYDGLFFRYGGFTPKLAPFEAEYRSDLLGLTLNSSEVDRRLLAGLPWPVWEETVERLQGDLTDAAIEAAVRRMPPEYFRESGPELIRILRARRDRLGDAARRFYLQLAAQPEIHATDAAERVEVLRLPDGSVRVTLSPVDGAAAAPYFDRTFHPEDTDEIRIRLHGGDDRLVVHGEAAGGPRVRVVGGDGADTLRDLSRVRGPGARTAFHDYRGENVVEAGTEALVDPTAFAESVWIPGEIRPPRDWGAERSWFVPWAAYEGAQGILVGGGPRWTWYGFRRYPFAGRVQLRAMYGPRTGDLGADAVAEFRGVGAAPDVWLHGRVSALEDFRFHGLGNASPVEDEVEGAVVQVDQALFEARLRYRPREGLVLGAGPVLERLDPRPADGALARLPAGAAGAYGKAGLAAGLELETSPERTPREGGVRLRTEGHLFPATWDLTAPFARLRAEAAGYAPLPARSLLAARVGGAQVWGEAPLFDRVSLGGSETLRGFAYQRFTGDALVFGGLELRTVLVRAELGVRGDLGVLAFADAGRVFVDGESEGGWHRGYGTGLWFESLGYAVSVTYARGEEHRVYLKLGLPF